jgi:phosphoglycerate dehydrogenase-like enzyme
MTETPLRVVTAGALPASFPTDAFRDRVSFQVAQTDEELRADVRQADVLYSWQVPAEIPANTPELRWIQLPSAGADHLRDLPVWDSDVIVTAAKGIHTEPMSEHLLAMLLALTRQIPAIVRSQERHEWMHSTRRRGMRLTELRGKTMGIVGWGRIGNGVAHMARALGMRVIGTRWSVIVPREITSGECEAFEDAPFLEPVELPPDIVYPAAQLHEILAQSDVVVLILPLTNETRESFGESEFRAMRRGSIFCNVGRGAVVDEAALVAALQSGRLAGAALDVYSVEPLPRSSPLWSMPNVIVSPHVGGVSDNTRERAARLFAVNLTRYLDGQTLLNMVDKNRGY